MRFLVIIGVWIAVFATTVNASARTGFHHWMPDGIEAPAPLGFSAFCAAQHPVPLICRADRAAVTHTSLPDWQLARLSAFNRAINRRIRYVEDRRRFGVADRWSVADRAGDCEDIALAKHAALVRAGWPPASLWLAVGRTDGNAFHAVLVVRTDRGDFVLDNRTDRPILWNRAGIEWFARHVPSEGRWQFVDPVG